MEALGAAFAQPPAAFRPWVYWMWLNGNVTRNGITADLEAMQRVGIGGVLIMDVDQGAPQGPIRFAVPIGGGSSSMPALRQSGSGWKST